MRILGEKVQRMWTIREEVLGQHIWLEAGRSTDLDRQRASVGRKL